ncbi:hypothetical protein DSCW_59620 [Desulfosarcina widdelii]|uniref:Cysteine rich repeat domain protein n=1 Tax=Desulfosarcina widdelii TaxID=947919 RepID=A0A5K7ZCP1_9BACT|nr:cysteine rich repeat-containing protein [Desulfosarcina widdelii]BBO78545.1 hypothetical protein DSCW_59620 [Desulfosarcina widdelii]
MRKSANLVSIMLVVLLLAAPSLAGDNLVQSVLDGCDRELKTYCKDVTPGEGRLLACLYAHGDKLSGQCEYALYDAAVQLERAVAALSYLVNECRDDLDALCSGVPAGQGRLLKCLEENDAKVSGRCKQAVKEVVKQ